MKVCRNCDHEFEEQFKFCPECGNPFGDFEMKRKLDQHLMGLKSQAGREAALSRRAFGGQGFGDSNIGPIYGGQND